MSVSVKVSDAVYKNVSGVYLPLTDGTGNHYFADAAWMEADGDIEIPGLKKLWFHIKKTDAGGANITGLSLPDCTEVLAEVYGAFTKISMPKLTAIKDNGAIKAYKCTELHFPALKSIPASYALGYSTTVTKIVLPVIETITGNDPFTGSSALKTLVFGGDAMIPYYERLLTGCTKLLDGESGFIYVKSAVLEEYQADESWAASGVSFRAIEEYPEVLE